MHQSDIDKGNHLLKGDLEASTLLYFNIDVWMSYSLVETESDEKPQYIVT